MKETVADLPQGLVKDAVVYNAVLSPTSKIMQPIIETMHSHMQLFSTEDETRQPSASIDETSNYQTPRIAASDTFTEATEFNPDELSSTDWDSAKSNNTNNKTDNFNDMAVRLGANSCEEDAVEAILTPRPAPITALVDESLSWSSSFSSVSWTESKENGNADGNGKENENKKKAAPKVVSPTVASPCMYIGDINAALNENTTPRGVLSPSSKLNTTPPPPNLDPNNMSTVKSWLREIETKQNLLRNENNTLMEQLNFEKEWRTSKEEEIKKMEGQITLITTEYNDPNHKCLASQKMEQKYMMVVVEKEEMWNEQRSMLEQEIGTLKERSEFAKIDANNATQLQAALAELDSTKTFSTTMRSEHDETLAQMDMELTNERASKTECLGQIVTLQCRISELEQDMDTVKDDAKTELDKERDEIKSIKDELTKQVEDNKCIKDKSNALRKELIDSTKAFEETITSYESVIADVKKSMSEKTEAMDVLKKKLDEQADIIKQYKDDTTKERAEMALKAAEKAHVTMIESLKEKKSETERLQNELDDAKLGFTKSTKENNDLKGELRRATVKIDELSALGTKQEKESDRLRQVVKAAEEARQVSIKKVKSTQEEMQKTTAELNDARNYTDKLKVEQDEMLSSIKHEFDDLQNQVTSIESAKEESKKTYEKHIASQQDMVDTLHAKHSDAKEEISALTVLMTNLTASLECEKDNNHLLTSRLERSEADARTKSKELIESTTAFEEAIQSYESVIAKVKHTSAEKKDENDILKAGLEEAKKTLTDLKSKQEDDMEAYRKDVDELKKELSKKSTTVRLMDEDKTKLRWEVERLKADLSDVSFQYEKSAEDASKETEAVKDELEVSTSKNDDLMLHNEKQEDQIISLREEVRKAEDAQRAATAATKSTQKELERAIGELNDLLSYTNKLKADHEDTTASLKHELTALHRQAELIAVAREEKRKNDEREHRDAHNKIDSLSMLVTNLKQDLECDHNEQTLLSHSRKASQILSLMSSKRKHWEHELATY